MLPMGRVTRDYLIALKLCPHQCAPNLFRILDSVDALNEHMGLNLTWHDVVWMYECHLLANSRYYLMSRSFVIRLVSCLPKSNKGVKDDFLIVSGEWRNGLHCLVRERKLGRVPQVQVSPFFFFIHGHQLCDFTAFFFFFFQYSIYF